MYLFHDEQDVLGRKGMEIWEVDMASEELKKHRIVAFLNKKIYSTDDSNSYLTGFFEGAPLVDMHGFYKFFTKEELLVELDNWKNRQIDKAHKNIEWQNEQIETARGYIEASNRHIEELQNFKLEL